MRLAVPSEDERGLYSNVIPHFGRARFYTIVDVEGSEIRSVRVVQTPFEEHGPGDIPGFFRSLGVDVVLAYGMGVRARQFFSQMGIQVVTGVAGKVGDVVKAYLAGSLVVDADWESRQGFREHRHEHGHRAT